MSGPAYATNLLVPTSGSNLQVEPVGYAGAAGFQDVRARNMLAGTGAANTAAVNGFAYTQSGAGAPVGVPSSLPTGSPPLYVDTTNAKMYAYYGAAWNAVGSGASSLQAAYNGGNAIVEAGGLAVAISSTTADNGNVLTVTKNPAGAQSGDGIDVTMGATTTGNAFQATMTAGATGLSFLGSSVGGGISCPGAGAGSERFGNGATAVGSGATALGPNSIAGGANSVAVGASATTGGGAFAGGVAVGVGAGSGGVNGIAIGFSTNSAANAIAMGNTAQAQANQFVAGSSTANITDVFFGAGSQGSSTTGNYTIHGTPSNANGTAGFNLTLAGGLANQAADSGGSVTIQTAVTGAGTTLVDRVLVNPVAKTLTDNVATNLVQATVASNSVAGWHLGYTITVFDGTDLQVEHGVVYFTATNKAGTMATDASVAGIPSRKLTAGTLVVTWDFTTGAGTATCRVTADTSLTATTFTIVYTLENDSIGAVAIQ